MSAVPRWAAALSACPVLAILAAAGWTAPLPSHAQEPPTAPAPAAPAAYRAVLSAAPGMLTVGDPFTLTLEVTHPLGTRIVVPRLDPAWGDFEVRAQSPAVVSGPADRSTADESTKDGAADDGATGGDSAGNGTSTTRQTIVAALFAPGSFTTPPLRVLVVEGDGQASTIAVAPAQVTVDTVLKTGDQMPRDIRPQAVIPPPPLWPRLIAGLTLAGAALVIAGFAARRLARRGDGLVAAPPVVDTRGAYQIALDELGRIEGLDLVARRHYKTHYTLVADCLRAYLAAAYGIPALDQTSSETLGALAAAGAPPAVADPLRRFLAAADLVKFARQTPAPAAAAALIGEARALVDVIHTHTQPPPDSSSDLSMPVGMIETPPPPVVLGEGAGGRGPVYKPPKQSP